MSTLVIIQRNHGGHRLTYVRHLVLGARDRGWQVQVWTTSLAPGSAEWLMHLDGVVDPAEVQVVDDWSIGALDSRLATAAPDRAVVPDGDWLLPAVTRGLLHVRGGSLVLLVMRPRGQGSSVPKAMLASGVKAALRSAARRRQGVVVLELASSVSTNPSRHEVRDPVAARPKPGSDDDYRAQWDLDADVHWFGAVGALDERKNLDLVSEALRAMVADDRSFGLVLAGSPSPHFADKLSAIVAELRRGGVRVSTQTRLLDDDEFDAAVRLIDTMVIAHSNEGPSGVLAQCALAGTPVVCAGARSLKRDAEEIPHLASWVPLEVSQLQHALTRALDASREATASASYGTVPQFVESFLGPAPAGASR